MLNALFLFLAVVFIKSILNLWKLYRCKHYLTRYHRYIKNPDWQLAECESQVVNLFKGAGVEDAPISYVEPAGYGFVVQKQLSTFRNITKIDDDVIGLTLGMFHKAIGVYRSRMIESFNPLYWLEIAVHLPKQVLGSLGVPPESVFARIAQLVYWGICAIIAAIFTLFGPEIRQIVRDWIAKVLS
jgi:hypothetical protein